MAFDMHVAQQHANICKLVINIYFTLQFFNESFSKDFTFVDFHSHVTSLLLLKLRQFCKASRGLTRNVLRSRDQSLKGTFFFRGIF